MPDRHTHSPPIPGTISERTPGPITRVFSPFCLAFHTKNPTDRFVRPLNHFPACDTQDGAVHFWVVDLTVGDGAVVKGRVRAPVCACAVGGRAARFTHPLTHTQSLTHTHTNTHTHTLSLSLNYAHTLSRSLSSQHTHSLAANGILALSFFLTPSLTLPSHTHTHTLSLSYTQHPVHPPGRGGTTLRRHLGNGVQRWEGARE